MFTIVYKGRKPLSSDTRIEKKSATMLSIEPPPRIANVALVTAQLANSLHSMHLLNIMR